MRLMGKVLEEIGKSSNLAAYGKNEVINAANAGAVERLLVLDEKVREEETENIMNLTESTGGKVTVVSSEHEGGKQLKALGGIAAILRYSLG
jgi:protein pelota